jgi:hypothetical protein
LASGVPPNHSAKRSDPPAHAPETVTLELDGETILYQRRTGAVHRLDPVGSVVWRFLDGKTAVADLVDDLSVAFATDVDVVRDGVSTLLVQLTEASLLAGGPIPEEASEPALLTNPPSP